MSGYNFDEQEDEGIFADDPPSAAGDPNAKADMEMQSWVPGITLGVGPDGLIEMPPDDGSPSVLDAPPPVMIENLICLGGPCKHYTENYRLVPEGPSVDAESNVEAGRWCGKLRTWAEQTDLTEAEVYACTAFTPGNESSPSDVRKACEQNAKILEEVRLQQIDAKARIGICVAGACEDYFELILKTPSEEQAESRRYCMRLAGLGRLYDLREKPVFACTHWKPVGGGASVGIIAAENIKRINNYRKVMAERDPVEEE